MTLVNGSIHVDGFLRTQAPSGFSVPSGAGPEPWYICSVAEAELGNIRIGSGCSYVFCNAKLSFNAGKEPEDARVAHRSATFTPVAPPAVGAFLLAASATLGSCVPSPGFGPVFATAGSAGAITTWLLHDPRLRLLRNTPEMPVNSSAEHYPGYPLVRQSLLNPEWCSPAQAACYQPQYESTLFRFNSSVIRAFYELGGLYIHSVAGLRTDVSRPPCLDQLTRWKRSSACRDAEMPGTPRLNPGTHDFLASAIQAADDGAAVVDISTGQPGCTVAAAGITINVTNLSTNRSECWAHSHPDALAAGYAEGISEGDAPKALRTAIQLFAAAPELSTTGIHSPVNSSAGIDESHSKRQENEDENPPPAANVTDYKAIVYVYLSGGADSYNFLIPHASCSAMAEQYRTVRGAVALDPNAHIPTDVPAGTQPCDRFATHASLSRFKQLYDAGDAAYVANIGPLIQPVTKERFLDGTAVVPPSIGAHNGQTKATQSVHAQATAPLGVLGRVRDALQSVGIASAAYSIFGNSFVLKGASSAPPGDIVDRKQGATPFDEYGSVPHLREHIDALVRNGSSSILGQTWADSVKTGLSRSEDIAESLTTDGALKQTFAALSADSSGFSNQLFQAARLIAARKSLGSQRDVFFVTMGAFDTHADAFATLQTKMGQIDVSLHSFVEEMKLQGVWSGVTIVTASEFGRTITSNGAGTDHGWGGISLLASGSLRAATVFGQYPHDLSDASSLNVGRGRLIPTLSWEALWSGVASWFGVPDSLLEQVLPNLPNFPNTSLLNASQLYRL